MAMGGLYAAPDVVRSILAPQEGQTKRILDIGMLYLRAFDHKLMHRTTRNWYRGLVLLVGLTYGLIG